VCQSSCIPVWQAQASVGLWAGVGSWGYRVLLPLHSTLFLYQFQHVCMCVCVEWGRCQNRRVSVGMGDTVLREPGGGFMTRGEVSGLTGSAAQLSLSLSLSLSTNSILFHHKLLLHFLHNFLFCNFIQATKKNNNRKFKMKWVNTLKYYKHYKNLYHNSSSYKKKQTKSVFYNIVANV